MSEEEEIEITEEESKIDTSSEREKLVQDLKMIIEDTDYMIPAEKTSSVEIPLFNSGSLDLRKCEFIQYIENNIQKLKIRSNILRFKYNGYKGWFDKFNLSILGLSSVLTLLEALRAKFAVNNDDTTSIHGLSFSLVPIFISSIVTLFSALIKFKRYEIKMQLLESAIQKAIFTIFRLKKIQESAKHLIDFEELETLIQMYSGEPFDLLIQTLEEMEKNLRYEDLVKHMKTYYDLSLDYERSEINYRLNRLLLSAKKNLQEKNVDGRAGEELNSDSKKCCNEKKNNILCCFTNSDTSPV
jgi:hypothetical protein